MSGSLITVIALLIGLALGFIIGNLISKNKNNGGADSALLADYKSQLEAERDKTENSIKLTAELSAMKETVQKLSQQSNEANLKAQEEQAKLDAQIALSKAEGAQGVEARNIAGQRAAKKSQLEGAQDEAAGPRSQGGGGEAGGGEGGGSRLSVFHLRKALGPSRRGTKTQRHSERELQKIHQA
jgi:uncharacterized membrane-anchored protein YhcB (DUF1043 family)